MLKEEYFELDVVDKSDWLTWISDYRLVFIMLGVSVVLIGGGFYVYFSNRLHTEGVVVASVPEVGTVVPKALLVDVAGAVMSPGVYSLPLDSRVDDALFAAGGVSDSADNDWISLHLNRAEKVVDGSKIYIPEKSDFQILSPTLVSINFGSIEELEELPGIGEVTAKRIIDGRPYHSVNELLSREIIGEGVWTKIESQVSL